MSNLGLSITMMEAYQNIVSALSTFHADSESNKIDTLAIIICTTKYCFFQFPDMYAQVREECAKFLLHSGYALLSRSVDSRIHFYSEFINGKQPYGEWLFNEDGFGRDNALLRAQAAYGDIIFDPTSRDSYDDCQYSILTDSEFRFMRMLQDRVLGVLHILQLKCYEAQKRKKHKTILYVIMIVLVFIVSFFIFKTIL